MFQAGISSSGDMEQEVVTICDLKSWEKNV